MCGQEMLVGGFCLQEVAQEDETWQNGDQGKSAPISDEIGEQDENQLTDGEEVFNDDASKRAS